MLIDTRLTDEAEASSRVFRVYAPLYNLAKANQGGIERVLL